MVDYKMAGVTQRCHNPPSSKEEKKKPFGFI